MFLWSYVCMNTKRSDCCWYNVIYLNMFTYCAYVSTWSASRNKKQSPSRVCIAHICAVRGRRTISVSDIICVLTDGAAVSEPVSPAVYTRRPSTIERATFGPIYALPPAAWDDRLDVPAAPPAAALLLQSHPSTVALAEPPRSRMVRDQLRWQQRSRFRPEVLVVWVQWLTIGF